eukprot:4244091-Alexandrium_andersonii.AAC.1
MPSPLLGQLLEVREVHLLGEVQELAREYAANLAPLPVTHDPPLLVHHGHQEVGGLVLEEEGQVLE